MVKSMDLVLQKKNETTPKKKQNKKGKCGKERNKLTFNHPNKNAE